MNYEILIWIPVIIFHELGHWIGYKIFKFKPNIKLKWYGILIGENCYMETTPISAYIINGLGIMFGYLILIMNNSPIEWILFYFVMCSIDIVNILNILQTPKSQKNMTIREIAIIQLKELINTNGKTKI